MTISEFEKLHREKRWTAFYYLSENQKGHDCANPLAVDLTFQQMMVSVQSSVICFKGHSCLLRLDRVRRVECENQIIGDVLRVSCANPRIKGSMVEHIIIAE